MVHKANKTFHIILTSFDYVLFTYVTLQSAHDKNTA